jgi:inositol polyphosphate 5-phosphatase INPP5B/F
VGTFNVNGKLPAQDLSTWLGSVLPSSHANHNEQKHSTPSDKGTGEAIFLHGFRTVAHSSIFAGMEEGQTSAPEADMLVLAFQEVDLSTEAFFNFIGSAREDAWTVAILAGLGDKAELYEKVNVLVATAGTYG